MKRKKEMRILYTFLFSILTVALFAQPANDNCTGATTLPQNCPPTAPTAGTTVGANDSWAGIVGCQSGNNHPDVWYTFTATGTLGSFTVTNGTMTGNVEFILTAATSCGFMTVVNSTCGPSPLTVNVTLTPGQQYFLTISSSTGSQGTFNICLNVTSPPPAPGQDCNNASILCNSSTFSQGTSNAGIGTQEVNTGNSCWGSGGERQSKWFKFTAGCTGTLEIAIDPNTNTNDYDWAVWNITGDPSGCTTKGNSIACNWSGCTGTTGMSSCANPCTSEGAADCGGPPGCQSPGTSSPITITAGQVYALLVDNFTTSNSGFSLRFGGACGGGTAVIGPDTSLTYSIGAGCTTYTFTKTCAISPTTNNTYAWDMGDGSPIITTMNATYTYALAGTYVVTFTVTDLLGCSRTTSRTIVVSPCLPIELGEFNAYYDGRHVQLDWMTYSETNNDYFAVERTTDGINFEEIARVNGSGTTPFASYYSSVDKKPHYGLSYYRLKQTDVSGAYAYSKLVPVDITKIYDFNVVPNPASSSAEINVTGLNEGQVTISFYNTIGELVKSTEHTSQKGNNTFLLDVSTMEKGVYFITVNTGKKILKSSFVKN